MWFPVGTRAGEGLKWFLTETQISGLPKNYSGLKVFYKGPSRFKGLFRDGVIETPGPFFTTGGGFFWRWPGALSQVRVGRLVDLGSTLRGRGPLGLPFFPAFPSRWAPVLPRN